MNNITISQLPVNTDFEVKYDHTDYGVNEQIFNKLNDDIWLKLMSLYVEMLTPSQKHYFFLENKSNEDRVKAFKEFVRFKKSLGLYFKAYEERYLALEKDREFKSKENADFGSMEPCDVKQKEPKDKDALVQHLREHPEAFKMMKKTGALSNDTFNVTVFSRGPAFRVIDKIERSKLTYLDEEGIETDLLRDKFEKYFSVEGTYDLAGPHLCTFDAKVLCALFLIHSNGVKQGLRLHTSFNEIARFTDKDARYGKKASGGTFRAIKRSLFRLSHATLSFQPSKGQKGLRAFSGSLIQYDGKVEQGEMKSFYVDFSKCLIDHFVFGSFSHIDADLLASLTPWESKLVMYLSSHDYGTSENPFKMGKEKLKEHLAPVTKQGFGNIKMESFERQLRIAIKGLIAKGYLDPASGIKKGVYIFIKAPRKPFVKQPLKRVVKGPSQNYSLPQ